MKRLEADSRVMPPRAQKEIERNTFSVAKGEDVVGQLASVRLEKGDTLPDLARHFGLGVNAVTAANPGVDVWVPEEGRTVMLPLSFILPDSPRKGIVVNLATMRLFQYQGDERSPVVSTYPIGIGTKDTPTPTGRMRVERKTARPTWHVPASIAARHKKKGDILPAQIPPGPENPLGDYALYLSKAGYLIHGTNKPASIGLQASNGCLRLYPENVKALYETTPVSTPVAIVDQPYLLGQRDGIVYLEAHTPLEGSGAGAWTQIYGKLRKLEKKLMRTLDWKKIEQVNSEARGIPVAILELVPGSGKDAGKVIEVAHPDKLQGAPEVPELKPEGWYVLAAEFQDKIEAQRLAAIINHQGPQIPARVLPGSKSNRVLAGPFLDDGEAKDIVKRLKFDLELDAVLVEPVSSK
jgi:L,D-transpeptidase ErfK/SrfK